MNNISTINDLNFKIIDEILDLRLSNLELTCLLVTIIDNVPSDALPHLAEQYHITGNEGWLQSRNDSEKRDLIKRAIEVHRYKGTKYALTKIFDMFGIEGQIQEWFETGGEPFTFSVDINFISKGLDYNLIAKLEDLIKEYKNVRSHMSNMNISISTVPKAIEIKAAMITGENVIVFPKPANLIWDEQSWDIKTWGLNGKILSNAPVLRFDETNFDDTAWAFG